MSRRPKPAEVQRRYEYVASCRIAGESELVLLPYTVFAHTEEDAQEAIRDLLRDEGGMIALIQTPSPEEP
jgi:LmbE family N-acetylglucosaminyl deacetylase